MTRTTSDTRYGFDNSTDEARIQLSCLAGFLDPHTFTVLKDLNLPAGGRYADIGAGAGTVATWLANHTGPHGRVVVIDRQPQHVPQHPNITIWQQDVATAELEPASFNAIHARLLLMHLDQREQILANLAAALRPGGKLIVSDWAVDHLDDMFVYGPDDVHKVFLTFQHELIRLLEQGHGMDSTWARRVPAVMRHAGLTVHSGETFNRLMHGGEPGMLLHASNSRQKQAELMTAGMTEADLDLLRTAMSDPTVITRSWPMHTTVGQRPTA